VGERPIMMGQLIRSRQELLYVVDWRLMIQSGEPWDSHIIAKDREPESCVKGA
jgi:hypothetical protein